MRLKKQINTLLMLLSLATFAAATLGMNTRNAFGDEGVFKRLIKSSALIAHSSGRGSGVLVDKKNRLVVTNAHVVGDHSDIVVVFPQFRNGKVIHEHRFYQGKFEQLGIKASVVALDESRDVAVLKLSSLPSNVEAIEFGKSPEAGQSLHSIGNPGASQARWIYSGGKLRANYYSTFRSSGKMHQFQMLETYIPTSEGVSGGPIADNDSRLVGINQGYRLNVDGFSYGVDISEIKYVLKKHGLMNFPSVLKKERDIFATVPKKERDIFATVPSKRVSNSLANLSLFKTGK